MVMIVNGGPDVFAAIAFGPDNPTTVNFLEQQVSNFSSALTDAGRAFMERGRNIFDRFYGSEAARLAKAAIRTTQHMFQHDVVMPLTNIAAMQQAKPTMQRWIMACPTVREMYHMQRCDGYSDSYVDMQPGCVGADHYDYRKVMNGVIVEGDENADYDWKKTTWLTDFNEEDVNLTISEKADILTVWDLISTMMKPGKEDPTSPYCTTL